jgi:hypothetical protein
MDDDWIGVFPIYSAIDELGSLLIPDPEEERMSPEVVAEATNKFHPVVLESDHFAIAVAHFLLQVGDQALIGGPAAHLQGEGEADARVDREVRAGHGARHQGDHRGRGQVDR